MGVFPPDCPGEDKFSTPVLSEMLSEETFIRREILTLGALINQKHQSVKKSLYYRTTRININPWIIIIIDYNMVIIIR